MYGVGIQTNDVAPGGVHHILACRDPSAIEVHTELDPLPMRLGKCIRKLPHLLVPLRTIVSLNCNESDL